MQRLNVLCCRITIDLDFYRYIIVTGIAGSQAEEGMQIEIAFKFDAEILEFNSGSGRVGGIADGKTIAKRSQHLLDRIRSGIGAAELAGLYTRLVEAKA